MGWNIARSGPELEALTDINYKRGHAESALPHLAEVAAPAVSYQMHK